MSRTPCCGHLWEVFSTTQFNSCPSQQDSKENNSQKIHWKRRLNVSDADWCSSTLISALSDTHINIIYVCQDHLTSQPPLKCWGFPSGALGLGSGLSPERPQCSFLFCSCLVSLTHTPLALTAAKARKGKILDSRTWFADLLCSQFCQLCKGSWLFLC